MKTRSFVKTSRGYYLLKDGTFFNPTKNTHARPINTEVSKVMQESMAIGLNAFMRSFDKPSHAVNEANELKELFKKMPDTWQRQLGQPVVEERKTK